MISHFELECRLKPGDYPLSCYVVVGDALKRLDKTIGTPNDYFGP